MASYIILYSSFHNIVYFIVLDLQDGFESITIEMSSLWCNIDFITYFIK